MTFKKKNLIKKIKNFTINFGPQPPAAHGVLKLVTNYLEYIATKFVLSLVYFDDILNRRISNIYVRVFVKLFLTLFAVRLVFVSVGAFVMPLIPFSNIELELKEESKVEPYVLATSSGRDELPEIPELNRSSGSHSDLDYRRVTRVEPSSGARRVVTAESRGLVPVARPNFATLGNNNTTTHRDWGTSEGISDELKIKLLQRLSVQVAEANITEVIDSFPLSEAEVLKSILNSKVKDFYDSKDN
uniref:Uncharacterized protein n=1 Tax=Minutocellus polymorphus TaxID=265543 RepID=A0A8A6KNB5_9STRA|nr:hypothetical protein [Minutocellus polymorphus]